MALVPGEVPERKRYCSNCQAKLSRAAGFCPHCGQEYSFTPSLQPGDVVAGKYEVRGTLAFGGLGWIYLALDQVLSRWVVLKGLLNARDPNMVAVAIKEREYLAAVKHHNIVSIYDFITQGREGYIVMEFVNGKTLMTLRREHGGPLPPAEAISYILEVLPAFAYLADQGLVYCDFKAENAMVEGEAVKLIDMGAVRQVDDLEGDIYGTRGYSAPEATDEPSHLADLYTVARTLAVLVADFDFQREHEHSLPPPDLIPAFAQHESLYRFLCTATRASPAARFQSAQEMAEQLLGVLRDVAAGGADLGTPDSAVFETDVDDAGDDGDAQGTAHYWALPALKTDAADPAAGVILAAGALSNSAQRRDLLAGALARAPDSVELRLRLAAELIAHGAHGAAASELARLADELAGDWRLSWLRGRQSLADGEAEAARAAFQAVYDELPGEVAPRLALGHAAALAGNLPRALEYYGRVARVDPRLTGAAFASAVCCRAQGDRDGAVAMLAGVPRASRRYADAQLALARALLAPEPGPPGVPELERAATALAELDDGVERLDRHALAADLYCQAASLVERDDTAGGRATRLLGIAWQPGALRAAAERELRACAHLTPEPQRRISYVDEANRVRPFTLV